MNDRSVHKDKHIRKILKEAEEQGFIIKRTGNGYPRILKPNGEYVAQMSATPSDYRAYKNFMSSLRRGGFKDNHGKG